jgi:hypothetical protein
MATALPWLLVGMTASVVLVSRLSGDVRRIGRSDRFRDAIFLAIALGLAAAAAQLIQISVVDAFREIDLTREQLPSLRLVPMEGLAEFACGAVIGFMVPQAFRANLVTPSDPTTARALRNLLRAARAAHTGQAAGDYGVHVQRRAARDHAGSDQYKAYATARELLEDRSTAPVRGRCPDTKTGRVCPIEAGAADKPTT